MVKDYKVITLCGSTRFKKEFESIQKELTLLGNIVISVGLYGHSGDEEVWLNVARSDYESKSVISVIDKFETAKEMLDDMHRRKIDMSDEIFVINPGGYIGDSTRGEIAYAISTGKKINYLENPDRSGKSIKIISDVDEEDL